MHNEHTHSHEHGHSHDHEHPHTHDHLHGEGCAHNHEHCCGHNHEHNHAHTHAHTHDGVEHTHSHVSMQQLLALISYMESHNAAHTNELADLAKQLDQAGSHDAYHKVLDAVSCYRQGDQYLSAVLAMLKK